MQRNYGDFVDNLFLAQSNTSFNSISLFLKFYVLFIAKQRSAIKHYLLIYLFIIYWLLITTWLLTNPSKSKESKQAQALGWHLFRCVHLHPSWYMDKPWKNTPPISKHATDGGTESSALTWYPWWWHWAWFWVFLFFLLSLVPHEIYFFLDSPSCITMDHPLKSMIIRMDHPPLIQDLMRVFM